MTWVGLDVHARSTHAARVDVVSGELTRVRFGAGTEGVVDWLARLPGPVRAVYEAGPTGFALLGSQPSHARIIRLNAPRLSTSSRRRPRRPASPTTARTVRPTLCA
jgi:hypothetical protein